MILIHMDATAAFYKSMVSKSMIAVDLRISKLYMMVSATTTLPSPRGLVPDSQRVKLEAWLCKGFCVLVKRKLSRAQVPRSKVFRRFLSALSGQDRVLFWLWSFTFCACYKFAFSKA